LHRRPANPKAGGAVTSTNTSSVTATDDRSDDGAASGAIELFQPTQLRRLQSRSPLHSLEPLAKPAC